MKVIAVCLVTTSKGQETVQQLRITAVKCGPWGGGGGRGRYPSGVLSEKIGLDASGRVLRREAEIQALFICRLGLEVSLFTSAREILQN